MNLTQLRAFHAVAQEGSFTRAADRLCVTQPAITASISALEERHGVPLFHRHGRNISLTEAGEQLREVASRLFALEEEAGEILTAHQELESGLLRIAIGSPYTIAPHLARFRESHPRIELKVVPGNFESVEEMLLSEAVDLAVQTEAQPQKQVARLPLAEKKIVAFCANNYPLPMASVSLETLARFSLVSRESGSATRRLFEQLCSAHDLEIPAQVQAESRETVFELVATGLGYGIVLSDELPQDSRVRTIMIDEATTPITDYLLFLKRRENLRLIKAFLEVVKSG